MGVRILVGDAGEMLKGIADESVHCVVTSPPYYGLRDYGVEGQIGLEASPAEYVAALVGVFREVRRVLRRDGTVFLNLGDSYAGSGKGGNPDSGKQASNAGSQSIGVLYGKDGAQQRRAAVTNVTRDVQQAGIKPKDLMMIPARVAIALQEDGWYLRSDIIWAKPNPMPESVTDRPTTAHEHLFLLAKSPSYFYDAEAIKESSVSDHPSGNGFKRDARLSYRDENGARGNDEQWTGVGGSRNRRSVWTIATSPYPEAHFATFPPDLVEPCILAGTSEYGVCGKCGGPWERLVEKQFTPQQDVSEERGIRCAEGQKPMDATSGWPGVPRGTTVGKTLGWQPTCSCGPDAGMRQAVVLDPFAGAFTTCLVADRLKRDAIGIELSPTYAEMGRKRLIADAGMFANVALD